MKRPIFGSILLILLVLPASQARASNGCGNLSNPYGPFDYTNAEHFNIKLPIIEVNHFTPDVEYLIKGISGSVGGDLDYTLRAFPNHHRALYAMAKYQIREHGKGGAQYTADCYFQRALLFKPDDGTVHFIYGIYLQKTNDTAKALEQYLKAQELIPNSAELHYDLGLLYVDLKDYPAARVQAKKAYAGGYQLEGLKNRLKAESQWEEQSTEAVVDPKPSANPDQKSTE